MQWIRSFGITEIIFIAAFVILYALYCIRGIRIARALNSAFHNIFIKLLLRSAIFALLIISILGPSFGAAKKEVKSVGKDILICLDLSKSMDAFDIQPTRLEKIKYEMQRIIDAFNSDRIGIIIFSGEAFVQIPLTYDQSALRLFTETLNTGLMPSGSTDFGPPMELALKKFKEEEGKPNYRTQSRVIVLISDGEDFGENTDEVADEVVDSGIKLFTLGVGTEKGGQIYSGNGLKKDRQGNVVTTKLNSDALKLLAKRTDGQYFEINESTNDVSRLINTISKIQGDLRDSRLVDVSANKYYYFLLAALCLLIVDILLNIKTIRI